MRAVIHQENIRKREQIVKKFIAILLVALMMLGVVSCGQKQDIETTDSEDTTGKVEDTDNKGEDKPSENVPGIVDPKVEAGTMGEVLWNAFLKEVQADGRRQKLVQAEIRHRFRQG